MSMKTLLRGAVAACLLAIPVAGWGTNTSSTTVTITQTVTAFAEWDVGPTTTITMPNITGTAAQTGSGTMHLYTNAAPAISVAAASDGHGNSTGILTLQGGSDVLDTQYMLDGAGLSNADVAFATYATVAAKTYNLDTVGVTDGNFTINLHVQAQVTGGNTAPAAGTYSAAVTVTATW